MLRCGLCTVKDASLFNSKRMSIFAPGGFSDLHSMLTVAGQRWTFTTLPPLEPSSARPRYVAVVVVTSPAENQIDYIQLRYVPDHDQILNSHSQTPS